MSIRLEVSPMIMIQRVDFAAGRNPGKVESLLRFDRINTLADIRLNEVYWKNQQHAPDMGVPSCKNPFLKRKYAQSGSLFPDRCARSYEEEPIIRCVDAMKGLPRLRKGHSMFGWDWGPRIPMRGPGEKVSLLGST